jgi:hypothetical protein
MGKHPEIRIAQSQDELLKVFGFRYEIYVDEMARVQHYADTATRTIQDPLDSTGINLYAISEEHVIGTIRNNAAADGSVGPYEDFYEMGAVGADHPERTSITTRFMIAPPYRRGTLAVSLAMASFLMGLRRNVRWNYIDCNSHLVPFFLRLGWVEYLPVAEHPEYGRVHRMRLDLMDRQHLVAVASPFAKCLEQWHRNREAECKSDDWPAKTSCSSPPWYQV